MDSALEGFNHCNFRSMGFKFSVFIYLGVLKCGLMKRLIFCFNFSTVLFFAWDVSPLSAQDLIYEKGGVKLVVEITGETDELIFYKPFGKDDPTSYFVEKSLIKKVRYADGREVILDANLTEFEYAQPDEMEEVKGEEIIAPMASGNFKIDPKSNSYAQGQRDANIYYKGHQGAGAGTLIVSLLSPLVGLIPAAATSSTPPRAENLGYPDPAKFEQMNYRMGYTDTAHQIKRRKVWTNWGVGLGVNLFLVLVIVAGGN